MLGEPAFDEGEFRPRPPINHLRHEVGIRTNYHFLAERTGEQVKRDGRKLEQVDAAAGATPRPVAAVDDGDHGASFSHASRTTAGTWGYFKGFH